MTAIVALVLVTLAAARVTRFLTLDKLAEPYRLWVSRRFPPTTGADGVERVHRVTYLAFCTWCTGIWVSAIAAVAVWFVAVDGSTDIAWWWALPTLWLAVAQLVGLIASE